MTTRHSVQMSNFGRRMLARLSDRHWLYIVVHVAIGVFGFFLVIFSTPTWLQGVGASLIAWAIAGAGIFVYVLNNESLAGRLDILARFGIVNVYSARAARIKSEYDELIVHAREAIDVLGFGLTHFRQDYADALPSWAEKAKVRILLIDPDYPEPSGGSYANQRDREERDEAGTIASNVRQFIKTFAELISRGEVHVRLYRCLPSVNIFRIDDSLFWGPYLIKTASRNSPTLLVERGGELFDVFTKNFDDIWDDADLSRDVPGEWLHGDA